MQSFARWISIFAHPFVLLPCVVCLSLSQPQMSSVPRAAIIGAMFAFISIIALFSVWRVRRGDWQHIDASVSRERRDLLRLAWPLMGLVTLLSWWLSAWSVWTRANVIVFTVLVLAALLRRWRHVSLHVTFAAIAVAIAATASWYFAVVVAVLTLLLCWSRLFLQRHRRSEVLIGLLLGALSGYLMVS